MRDQCSSDSHMRYHEYPPAPHRARPGLHILNETKLCAYPIRVENSRYPGSASTGLYPALLDGQFMLPGAEASHHVAKMRRDLDQNLTREEKVLG